MIVLSIVFSLLAYTGHYTSPDAGLCFVQACMIVGAFPMAATGALVVVFQIWAICHPGSLMSNLLRKTSFIAFLILLPYIVFAGFAVGSAIAIRQVPQHASFANGFYCSIQMRPFHGLLEPIVSIVLLFVIAAFEVAIVAQWYQRRTVMKETVPLAPSKLDYMMCIRVGFFNLYTLATMITAIPFVAIDYRPHYVSYMVDAGLPLATFLVFMNQRDVLVAWHICKELPPEDLSGTLRQSGFMGR
ncbi:hypothetical protein EWM64_g3990 [Hericium alpestre]|uniref:G-protein coupled receptors family 1 profile domain-containing protein n=1 Tax=Hericium alpestre TaxID=135208 RepID=A0A4Y9ZYW7_9AGAM|nr:hypothetical protein EWM64_g3990 [Hericium alpestre]